LKSRSGSKRFAGGLKLLRCADGFTPEHAVRRCERDYRSPEQVGAEGGAKKPGA
jgi:hypothetical protein